MDATFIHIESYEGETFEEWKARSFLVNKKYLDRGYFKPLTPVERENNPQQIHKDKNLS